MKQEVVAHTILSMYPEHSPTGAALVSVLMSPLFYTLPTTRERIIAIARAVTDYLMTHADATSGTPDALHFSDGFRRHVLGLRRPGQPGAGLSLADMADGVGVPVETLAEWIEKSG